MRCSRSPSARAISAFARELQTLGVELVRHGRHPRAPCGRRHRGGLGQRPDGRSRRSSAARSAPSIPQIYAGILARRDTPEQLQQLAEHGIGLIDLVVVNVKPFAPEVGRRHIGIDEAIELIDVGRRGAPRRRRPQRRRCDRDLQRRSTTPPCSRSCGRWARSPPTPATGSPPTRSAPSPPTTRRSRPTSTRSPTTSIRNGWRSSSRRSATCPYGENPHQRAAFYRETTHRSGSLADATQLAGRAPTFNNLLDLDAAYRIATDYTAPTVVITKHTDPVGIASAEELVEAYRRALDTDAVSSFGGIVGVNRELDGATAGEIAANSYEAVIAPGFSAEAARDPARQVRPGAPRRAGRPCRGHAGLRHREPGLQARGRRPAGRGARPAGPRPRPAPGRHPPPPHPGRAHRPPVRLARGAPRPLERHRPRPQRRDRGHRRGAGQPQRLGGHRAATGRAHVRSSP